MTVIPSQSVIEYIRHKDGTPYGVIVAARAGDSVRIGYSQCCSLDRFNKNRALEIAFGRAFTNGTDQVIYNNNKPIPHDIAKRLPNFIKRCERYYKININN